MNSGETTVCIRGQFHRRRPLALRLEVIHDPSNRELELERERSEYLDRLADMERSLRQNRLNLYQQRLIALTLGLAAGIVISAFTLKFWRSLPPTVPIDPPILKPFADKQTWVLVRDVQYRVGDA